VLITEDSSLSFPLSFHLSSLSQASPYVFFLFFVPVHYFTHVFLLFFSGVWATNIHDALVRTDVQ
jgi:lathosterol oxidase